MLHKIIALLDVGPDGHKVRLDNGELAVLGHDHISRAPSIGDMVHFAASPALPLSADLKYADKQDGPPPEQN